MLEIVGGVLVLGRTVTAKLLLVLAFPSLTDTVMVAVPACAAVGVTVTVRLAPVPPKTMFPLATSVGFDELPLTDKLPAVVCASATVKLIAPVCVSSLIVGPVILEIVGGVLFTPGTV